MKALGDDLGKLVLRLTLGTLLLFHGLPTFLAYGSYVGEVLAPVLIILGLFTRLCGLVVVGFMVMAVFLAHTSQFFMLNEQGGWELELQAFYFVTGLAVFLLGAGRYSVGGANGRWN